MRTITDNKNFDLKKRLNMLFVVLLLLISFNHSSLNAATTMTLGDVRARALEFNRTYLQAKEEITKAGSEITKAKSGALPTIDITGGYTRNFTIPSFFVTADNEVIEFKTGFKNNFTTTLMIKQPLYQGGKVFSALAIAKQYKKYASALTAQVEAEVLYSAELLFYAAILNRSNLEVVNKEYEAASLNLEVVEKMHSQGVKSDFELLRAKVEVGNLKPGLLQGESNLKLSHKDIKSFLGMDLNEELILVEEKVDTNLTNFPTLEELSSTALSTRPEMKQAELLTDISSKAIRIAKGGYYPSFDAISAYNIQSSSDAFTLNENRSKSFTAGISVTIPIFNGGYTRGDVTNRKAEYNQTRLALSETRDKIKLEVERAYDQLLQARRTLSVQGETIAQADEGLRIANLRYKSGIGTQLEVLSAQAALTSAGNSQAIAEFSYRKAKAELEKATTLIIN